MAYPDSPWLTLTQAAELLGVSARTVRRRICDGTIEARRLGRLVRIHSDQLGEDLGTAVSSVTDMERSA